MAKKNQEFIVKKNQELLDFLYENLVDLAKNKVKSLLVKRNIIVNNKPVTQYNYLLVPKDIVCIDFLHKNNFKEETDLKIIYEDNDLIVINKKSGLLTIETNNKNENTLYKLVNEYIKLSDKNSRIFIVHRIDKDTSGVVIFAKNEKMKKILQTSWNNLVKERIYYAIVEDHLKDKKGTIKSYLKENKEHLMYSTTETDGEKAITEYEVMKETKDHSMLKINILTGKKNQIRVHMKDIGHPIVGDKLYKGNSSPLKRLGLHANKITFIHPVTKKLVNFIAPVPANFTKLITDAKK